MEAMQLYAQNKDCQVHFRFTLLAPLSGRSCAAFAPSHLHDCNPWSGGCARRSTYGRLRWVLRIGLSRAALLTSGGLFLRVISASFRQCAPFIVESAQSKHAGSTCIRPSWAFINAQTAG